MKSFLALGALSAASLASARSVAGDRLLAIMEDLSEKNRYSKFLGDLESRGFHVHCDTPKSGNISLFDLGEREWDHVVVFPIKSKGMGPQLTAVHFTEFIHAEGNVIFALSSNTTTPVSITGTLQEADIHMPLERTATVVDHFHYDAASSPDFHDVLLLPPQSPVRRDIKDFFGVSSNKDAVLALPRTVGVRLGQSHLLNPIVRAPSTAYSYNPKDQAETLDSLWGAGQQLVLVGALQARNSARMLVLGSAEALEDGWLEGKKVKTVDGKQPDVLNKDFARRLSAWTFKETGVLRVNWVEHRQIDKGVQSNVTNPNMYRIKNNVNYAISISEYVDSNWVPFTVPANDALQLEVSMLYPFLRFTLRPDPRRSTPDATVFSQDFMLPDQHGIFNFKVNYKRPFLAPVDTKNTVSVRHMAHDEWPRSWEISAAWPYIAGLGVTFTGWLAFVALWLFSAPRGGVQTAKKTQ